MTIRTDVAFFSAMAVLLPQSALSAARVSGPDNARNFLNQSATGLVQTARLATAKYQNVSYAV
jgi:hypothetical protein